MKIRADISARKCKQCAGGSARGARYPCYITKQTAFKKMQIYKNEYRKRTKNNDMLCKLFFHCNFMTKPGDMLPALFILLFQLPQYLRDVHCMLRRNDCSRPRRIRNNNNLYRWGTLPSLSH